MIGVQWSAGGRWLRERKLHDRFSVIRRWHAWRASANGKNMPPAAQRWQLTNAG